MTKKKKLDKFYTQVMTNTEYSKMCLTCTHSYFRKDSYDGYCRYMEDSLEYMHPKPVMSDDLCGHWESKKAK